MATKSEQILAILKERYVCGALPNGALTLIGDEVGATRELVRQVANREGFTGRIPRQKKQRVCMCGATLPKGKRYCDACRLIPLSCVKCGEMFTRHRTVVLRNANSARYINGHSFCSRKCSTSWVGKAKGWGSPTHPHNATRGTHGTWGHRYGCRCGVCVAAYKAQNHKSYLRQLARKAERAAAGT